MSFFLERDVQRGGGRVNCVREGGGDALNMAIKYLI